MQEGLTSGLPPVSHCPLFILFHSECRALRSLKQTQILFSPIETMETMVKVKNGKHSPKPQQVPKQAQRRTAKQLQNFLVCALSKRKTWARGGCL